MRTRGGRGRADGELPAGGRGATEAAHLPRLIYRDLWPGIDLVFPGRDGSLKYEFILAPGTDLRYPAWLLGR